MIRKITREISTWRVIFAVEVSRTKILTAKILTTE
jgi:hypothetical protein